MHRLCFKEAYYSVEVRNMNRNIKIYASIEGQSTVNDMIVIKSVKENVGLGSRAGGKEYFK